MAVSRIFLPFTLVFLNLPVMFYINKGLSKTPSDIQEFRNSSTENQQSIYDKRLATLKSACKKFKLETDQFERSFMVSHEQKLAFCTLEKVSSTTWNARMKALDPVSMGECYGPKYPSRIIAKKYMGYTLAMTVRHPFERLLSTYRDKIINRPWRNWDKEIKVNIMSKAGPQLGPYGKPTFAQFIDFHLEGGTQSKSTNDYDMHVRPYWHTCDPCGLNYSVILHLETNNEDTRYVFTHLNMTDPLPSEKRHYNKSPGGQTNLGMVKRAMKSLRKDQLKKLLSIYDFDFQAFGYETTL